MSLLLVIITYYSSLLLVIITRHYHSLLLLVVTSIHCYLLLVIITCYYYLSLLLVVLMHCYACEYLVQRALPVGRKVGEGIYKRCRAGRIVIFVFFFFFFFFLLKPWQDRTRRCFIVGHIECRRTLPSSSLCACFSLLFMLSPVQTLPSSNPSVCIPLLATSNVAEPCQVLTCVHSLHWCSLRRPYKPSYIRTNGCCEWFDSRLHCGTASAFLLARKAQTLRDFVFYRSCGSRTNQ